MFGIRFVSAIKISHCRISSLSFFDPDVTVAAETAEDDDAATVDGPQFIREDNGGNFLDAFVFGTSPTIVVFLLVPLAEAATILAEGFRSLLVVMTLAGGATSRAVVARRTLQRDDIDSCMPGSIAGF